MFPTAESGEIQRTMKTSAVKSNDLT